jgi:hypothetical protein
MSRGEGMIRRICTIAALMAATAACAPINRQVSRLDARDTLHGSPNGQLATAESDGQTSMGFGDTYTATNLFERAETARGDPRARFNLAVGYERTGRLRQAQQIYQQLIDEGKFVRLQTVNDFAVRGARERWFTVSEEAARRNAYLQAYFAALDHVGGDTSTAATGVTAAPAAHIPDDQAFDLDARATNEGFPPG